MTSHYHSRFLDIEQDDEGPYWATQRIATAIMVERDLPAERLNWVFWPDDPSAGRPRPALEASIIPVGIRKSRAETMAIMDAFAAVLDEAHLYESEDTVFLRLTGRLDDLDITVSGTVPRRGLEAWKFRLRKSVNHIREIRDLM